MSGSRDLQVTVFGATGFTGRLVVEYLATHHPELSLGVAGRDRRRLDEVVERTRRVAGGAKLSVLVGDIGDQGSLQAITERSRVVLSTAGPFMRLGEPVVRACVEGGAHYADITGEPEFVDRVIQRYHEPAKERGLKLVSCCGFDSVPHDLGAFMTVKELPNDRPIVVEGFVKTNGSFSSGTYTSAIEAMGRYREHQADRRRRRAHTKRADAPRDVRSLRPSARFEPMVGAWVVPLPTIDGPVVLRSARALEEYGESFRYGHYLRVRSLRRLVALSATVGGVFAASQLPQARRLLLSRMQSGQGPSPEQRRRAFFEVLFRGRAGLGDREDDAEVMCRVAGGDPGYDETSKMAAESAVSLATDPLPPRAGALTPAVAMGDHLLRRLRQRGMTFERIR